MEPFFKLRPVGGGSEAYPSAWCQPAIYQFEKLKGMLLLKRFAEVYPMSGIRGGMTLLMALLPKAGVLMFWLEQLCCLFQI